MTSNNLTISRPKTIFADLLIASGTLLLFIQFMAQADWVLLVSWLFIFGYLMLTKRFNALVHQILATLIAIGWVHFAKDYYGYKFDFLKIFGMNILPLMAWTLALLGLGEMCNHLKMNRRIYYFLIFIPSFWFLLILFETVAYHVLKIRNTVTGSFAGLPYCDCIHAPTWMKVVYFSMGPVYYGSISSADELLGRWYPAFFHPKSGGGTEG